jgi:hypothetical protein
MTLYGTPPVDLGLVELSPKEMMFWMYCPIKLPGQLEPTYPDNLRQFDELAFQSYFDCKDRWMDSYVYLTAKTLWVSKDNPGNRPGWHSDGFMTEDLNYIWSDCNGTEFWQPAELIEFTQDHHASLVEMEVASSGPIATYPDKHLLRLDEAVIHRVSANLTPGMRTFVKVSISESRYDLEGNSVNHAFPAWSYVPRGAERNHTTSEA